MEINYADIDLNKVTEAMARYARDELGLLGAAVLELVTIVDKPGELRIKSAEYTTRLSRPPEPETRGPSDVGTDYLAMAHGKAAKRLRQELRADTQAPAVRRGEPEVDGHDAAWLTDTEFVVTAFSGAPKVEQDEIIAKWGTAKFKELASAQVWAAWGQFETEHPQG